MKKLTLISSSIAVLVLDRWSKYQVISGDSIRLEKYNFFLTKPILNRGISWSMFHTSSQPFFLFITVFISVITLIAAYAMVKNRTTINGLWYGLIVSGSVSNIIDRFFYGGVIDFITFQFFGLQTPIFNIADTAIVFGCIGIGYQEFVQSTVLQKWYR